MHKICPAKIKWGFNQVSNYLETPTFWSLSDFCMRQEERTWKHTFQSLYLLLGPAAEASQWNMFDKNQISGKEKVWIILEIFLVEIYK